MGTSFAACARMDESNLARLSDAELLALMHRVYRRSRQCNAHLIRILIAVEKRRLHLQTAHPSLFEFCVGRLGMSNSTAQRFCVATRLAAKFPDLIGRVERGEIHLTTLVQMRHHLTAQNAHDLLELARGRTRYQVEELLASVAPRPDAPSRMRKLPTPRTGQSVAPIERAVQPLTPERFRVQFNADRETRDDILQARDLMRHSNPSGDLERIFKFCVRAGVERLEARQHALLRKPARGPRPTDRPQKPASRHIPRAIRRAVFERDGARCTFHDDGGNRCPARSLLQLDHVDLYAKGGPHSLTNLRVRCRAHNHFHAEQILGKEFMEKRIASRPNGRATSPMPAKANGKHANGKQTANGSNGASSSISRDAIDDTPRERNVAKRTPGTSAAKPLTKTKKPRILQTRGPFEGDGTNG